MFLMRRTGHAFPFSFFKFSKKRFLNRLIFPPPCFSKLLICPGLNGSNESYPFQVKIKKISRSGCYVQLAQKGFSIRVKS